MGLIEYDEKNGIWSVTAFNQQIAPKLSAAIDAVIERLHRDDERDEPVRQSFYDEMIENKQSVYAFFNPK